MNTHEVKVALGCHVACCTFETADGSYQLTLCCAGGSSSDEQATHWEETN